MTIKEPFDPEAFLDVPPRSPDERALLDRCQATANRLLGILSEESQILRKFAPDELLTLLPAKQLLVRELEADLMALCQPNSESWKSDANPQTLPLRYTLAEIEKLNSANQVFVQGSLDFWEGFLSLLNPPTYGPTMESAAPGPARFKGRAINREV